MKLMFLYGPPAVGKFTVTKQLAGLTGFKLFHNHLTVDMVTSIFEFGSLPYFSVLRQMRFMILEEAIRADVDGVILTYVYGPSRAGAAGQYVELIERNGGEICLVRLYCDRAILSERVVQEDRKEYGKIVGVGKLEETLEELEEPFALIEGRESLSLDVGEMTAVEAAGAIMEAYDLPRVVS